MLKIWSIYFLLQALKDIPRDKYYLTTKVCRYQPEVDKMFDFSAERTIQSVDESLERMGVEYVDIIQVYRMLPLSVMAFVALPRKSNIILPAKTVRKIIFPSYPDLDISNFKVHDMEFAPNLDIIINETLPALQKVKDAGKARFIGITGYPMDNFQ